MVKYEPVKLKWKASHLVIKVILSELTMHKPQ